MNKIQLLARLKALEENVDYAISDLKNVLSKDAGHEFYKLGIKHTGERAIEHFDRLRERILRILDLANEPEPNKNIQPA